MRINDFGIFVKIKREYFAGTFLECWSVRTNRYGASGCLAHVKSNDIRMIISSAHMAGG